MKLHKKTTIALNDSNMLFSKGLKKILESISNLEVVGVGRNMTEAAQILKQHKPTIIIVDVHLIAQESLEELENILVHSANTKVILMSEQNYGADYIIEAFHQGVYGFLLKTMQTDELIEAIITISQGKFWFQPSISHYIAVEYKKMDITNSASVVSGYSDGHRPNLFTNREYQVLQLLVAGDSNLEIAEKLGITEFTVKTHLRNIFSKMYVNDRTNAALVAIRNNWVDINIGKNLSST